MVNTNISFKANFRIADGEYYTQEEWKTALKKVPGKTNHILDFLDYVNSNQGKEFLNRLPKEDTVELHILHDDGETVKVRPYFFYRSSDMTSDIRGKMEDLEIEGTWVEPRYLKNRFRAWTEKINYFLQSENENK